MYISHFPPPPFSFPNSKNQIFLSLQGFIHLTLQALSDYLVTIPVFETFDVEAVKIPENAPHIHRRQVVQAGLQQMAKQLFNKTDV